MVGMECCRQKFCLTCAFNLVPKRCPYCRNDRLRMNLDGEIIDASLAAGSHLVVGTDPIGLSPSGGSGEGEGIGERLLDSFHEGTETETLELFRRHDNDASVRDRMSQYLLLSCKQTWPTVAACILKRHYGGIDFGLKDQDGNTAFMWACNNVKMEGVALKMLDGMDAMPDCNNAGLSALMVACFGRCKRVATNMMDRFGPGVMPGMVSRNGITALMASIRGRIPELSMRMIDQFGAETRPEAADDEKGETAFISACRLGMDVAHLLIDSFGERIRPEQLTFKGKGALYWCCSNGMSDVAVRIIREFDHLVIPGLVCNRNTCLMRACFNRMSEVAMLLITKFHRMTGPERVLKKGKSALVHCCENDMSEVAVMILDLYDQCTFKRSDLENALMVSSRNGMCPVASRLTRLLTNY